MRATAFVTGLSYFEIQPNEEHVPYKFSNLGLLNINMRDISGFNFLMLLICCNIIDFLAISIKLFVNKKSIKSTSQLIVRQHNCEHDRAFPLRMFYALSLS